MEPATVKEPGKEPRLSCISSGSEDCYYCYAIHDASPRAHRGLAHTPAGGCRKHVPQKGRGIQRRSRHHLVTRGHRHLRGCSYPSLLHCVTHSYLGRTYVHQHCDTAHLVSPAEYQGISNETPLDNPIRQAVTQPHPRTCTRGMRNEHPARIRPTETRE